MVPNFQAGRFNAAGISPPASIGIIVAHLVGRHIHAWLIGFFTDILNGHSAMNHGTVKVGKMASEERNYAMLRASGILQKMFSNIMQARSRSINLSLRKVCTVVIDDLPCVAGRMIYKSCPVTCRHQVIMHICHPIKYLIITCCRIKEGHMGT